MSPYTMRRQKHTEATVSLKIEQATVNYSMHMKPEGIVNSANSENNEN